MNDSQMIRRLVKKGATRVGIQIARRSARTDPQLRRQLLLRWLGVDLMWDIGANIGQYARELREGGYCGRIVSFEPQALAFSKLEAAAADDKLWTVLNIALGDARGHVEMQISAEPTASSLLPFDREFERHPAWAMVGTESVRVETADDLLAKLSPEHCTVGIKLDAQGFEGKILAGARELLARAVFLECELLLRPFYEKQARPEELISLLYDAGLRLATAYPAHIDLTTGASWWMDAIFIRDPD